MQIYNPLGKFELKNTVAAFSRRSDGNMSLNYGDTTGVLDNRKKFLVSTGIDYRDLICAKQVHGNNVTYVTAGQKGSGALDYDAAVADTDGFLTDVKNLPIAILTADCLSVFIYDPRKPAIAILHAGWRSTEKNICEAGVNSMRERFGSKSKDLLVGFGPSIRSCCCQMEDNFRSNFPFGLVKRDGRLYLDIALINEQQLISCGVKKENIFDPKICTLTENEDFFSFRKEGQAAGRMISVIMLR